jgi:hypothetical protein
MAFECEQRAGHRWQLGEEIIDIVVNATNVEPKVGSSTGKLPDDEIFG